MPNLSADHLDDATTPRDQLILTQITSNNLTHEYHIPASHRLITREELRQTLLALEEARSLLSSLRAKHQNALASATYSLSSVIARQEAAIARKNKEIFDMRAEFRHLTKAIAYPVRFICLALLGKSISNEAKGKKSSPEPRSDSKCSPPKGGRAN